MAGEALGLSEELSAPLKIAVRQTGFDDWFEFFQRPFLDQFPRRGFHDRFRAVELDGEQRREGCLFLLRKTSDGIVIDVLDEQRHVRPAFEIHRPLNPAEILLAERLCPTGFEQTQRPAVVELLFLRRRFEEEFHAFFRHGGRLQGDQDLQ